MEVCKRCGGSKQSGYVQRLISEGKLDPSKVSNPSKFIQAMKESPKVDLNKPAAVIQSKFREFLNSRKKMDLFYIKLNEFLTARGSTRAYNKFLKENPEFDRDFVNSLVGTQKGMDFYPTPETCLAHKEILECIKKARNILEPTAGLGSIVHFISKHKKPSAKVTVNELNTTFIEPLKKFFPKFTITREDFLSQSPKNIYDLIICNPPFSIGKDKKAYLDFLLKCCYMLNTSSAKGEKCLIFICPEIIKKKNYWKEGEYNAFDFRSILDGIPFERVNKMYKELTNESLNKKEFQEYKDGESYYEVEMFEPQQSEWLGSCIGFGGTGVKAEIYRFIFV